MPKLENFTNRVEIDGVPYRKNELKYNSEGNNVVIVYSKEADVMQTTVIGQKKFNEWTNKNDISYSTIGALTNDLDLYLFDNTVEVLEKIERNAQKMVLVSDPKTHNYLEEILIELKKIRNNTDNLNF